MQEVTAENAADYLRTTGRASASELIEARELAGGVSNVVLLVHLPDRGARFVIKQSRPRLRVQQEWLCPVERIWREIDSLAICGKLLADEQSKGGLSASIPEVLWEDRGNYLYAMTAAPFEHRTWKELLLAGQLMESETQAAACGEGLLGPLHA